MYANRADPLLKYGNCLAFAVGPSCINGLSCFVALGAHLGGISQILKGVTA